jgi:hypothetical protein
LIRPAQLLLVHSSASGTADDEDRAALSKLHGSETYLVCAAVHDAVAGIGGWDWALKRDADKHDISQQTLTAERFVSFVRHTLRISPHESASALPLSLNPTRRSCGAPGLPGTLKSTKS